MSSREQEQFLNVLDRDEAERRFHAILDLSPLEAELVPVGQSWQRVLAEDVVAPIDVPMFDRSNVDGFAVHAEDTFGASETQPRRLTRCPWTVVMGQPPTRSLSAQMAAAISTGGMLPRGANAVVMVEDTWSDGDNIILKRPVSPGANVSFAGSDIGRGETVLRRGELLGARDTGILAALGLGEVRVVRRPKVALISTGDELTSPGRPLPLGHVYDSNLTMLADAVREAGGEPLALGIVPDEADSLADAVHRAVESADVVLLSGGTSKGPGDISYRVVASLGPPGIVAHGIALKPGKPLCLAAVSRPNRRTIPIAVLPGFPTSAIFTFHDFIAPIIRRLAGHREAARRTVSARVPNRINSERGRTEYLLVSLLDSAEASEAASTTAEPPPRASRWLAFPLRQGSGSVTAFSRADGFIVIPRQREYLEAKESVDVYLLDATVQPVDLVVIGSHCPGLDFLLGRLRDEGFASKFLAVGSTAGLEAARRGECDLAGIHLLDPVSDRYNSPFVTEGLRLISGYQRAQGLVFRRGDRRFEGQSLSEALAAALADPDCVMANRNRGSGTRILIDRLLAGARPPGYWNEMRSHHAVAAAVAQNRADWGIAIHPVAEALGLGFISVRAEQYDFVVPAPRWDRPAVAAFRRLLADPTIRARLNQLGFTCE
ncbi:MAG: molybdopterin biosynthesis protein [Gemmataceae bacterium]|nr:molybdopterin biosynthesis protein [Gemmataceae bacterium]